jgi:hypothetical protein
MAEVSVDVDVDVDVPMEDAEVSDLLRIGVVWSSVFDALTFKPGHV